MKKVTVSEVVSRVSAASFGNRLVTNVWRGHVVEAIVALALEPRWRWCSADYAAWDFQREDGTRLEVKQSAYLQSWEMPASGKIVRTFDVAPRTGRYEGLDWVADPRRQADIYILGYHGIEDNTADHRDPYQWDFFVIPEKALPPIKRIGLTSARRLVEPCSFGTLRDTVDTLADMLR